MIRYLKPSPADVRGGGYGRRQIDKVCDGAAADKRRCGAATMVRRCREGSTSRPYYYYYYYYLLPASASLVRPPNSAGDKNGAVLDRRRVKFSNAENTPRSVLAVSDGNTASSPYSCLVQSSGRSRFAPPSS